MKEICKWSKNNHFFKINMNVLLFISRINVICRTQQKRPKEEGRVRKDENSITKSKGRWKKCHPSYSKGTEAKESQLRKVIR